MSEFAGQSALITGGGSGMGRVAAQALAAEGAIVAVLDVSEVGGIETVQQIESVGGQAAFYRLDVADPEAVAEVIPQVARDLGGLHIAVNNAGVEGAHVKLADIPVKDYQRVMNIDLAGVFYCLKAEIPLMLENGGSIINTASASGLIGGYNLAAYTAAKHGVVGLTKAAAMDYGTTKLRINALCPGLVDTPFLAELSENQLAHLLSGTPMGRVGQPSEIADAIVWLASKRSSFVLGHALSVDGGATLGGVTTNLAGIE